MDKDKFIFPFSKFHRLTTYEGSFFNIGSFERADGKKNKAGEPITTFESAFTGHLGIKPYTANTAKKESNFMWRLKDAGLIEHMTVSFFVKNQDKEKNDIKSSIKFGSMDKIGL